MNNTVPKCKNCYYCDGSQRCHRWPPKISKITDTASVFPKVAQGDWCGEFLQFLSAERTMTSTEKNPNSIIAYHGSINIVKKASDLVPGPNEIGVHFGTLEVAEIAAGDIKSIVDITIPLDGKSLRLRDYGEQFSAFNVARQLALMKIGPDLWRAADIRGKLTPEDIWKVIEEKGYRRIVYLNRTEVPGISCGEILEVSNSISDEEFKAKFPSATDSYLLRRAY